jgi:hypothetical protein
MMLANDTCESFKMTLRLYLTGLKVEYNEKLDEYWIYNADGKFRFRLGKPYLVDPKDMNPLCNEMGIPYQNTVKHSLTEIAKGEYLYVKEADKGFADVKLPSSFLIDADTVYSSTADGQVIYNNSTFSTAHNAETGSATNATATSAEAYCCLFMSSYYIGRAFFYYNVSGLSGTASSVSEYLYGTASGVTREICTMQGTQAATLAKQDYDSFSGSYFAKKAHAYNQYISLDYNSSGVSAVNALIGSGTMKTCVRDYAYDYSNSAPPDALVMQSVAAYDDTAGTKDPYLYVTMGAGGSLPLKNVFNRPFHHMLIR